MNPRRMFEYTEEQKNLMKEVLDNGFCLTSDVFEKPVYVELATYKYNNEIYYFRIVNGEVMKFEKLSR